MWRTVSVWACRSVLWLGVLAVLSGQRVWAEETRANAANDAGATAQGASVPRLVQFSGVLKDQAGATLSGVQGVTFALYKEQSSGAALWIETQNVTADAEGRFAVLLGSTSPEGLPLELFSTGQARWLGVQAAGQEEPPRIFLASVPYALATSPGGDGSSSAASSTESKSSSPPTANVPPDSGGGGAKVSQLNQGAGIILTPNPIMEVGSIAANFTTSGGNSGDNGASTDVARGNHLHDGRYFTETELSGTGTINTLSNPVDWAKLKNVPEGFADGTDATGGTASDVVCDGCVGTSDLAPDAATQAEIDDEAAARAAADTTLQSNINSEAAARAAADNTLLSNINAEAAARAAADTTLQTNINSEAAARTAADTTLAAADAARVLKAGDTMTGKLTLGPSGAAGTPSVPIEMLALSLQSAISTNQVFQLRTEVLGNNTADATGRMSLLYGEGGATPGATGISFSHDGKLFGDGSNLTGVLSQAAVDTEAASRAAADTTLQNNIDAEAAARSAMDTQLQGNINTEAAARAAADTTLQNNIDAEAAARQAADTTLQNNINNEAAARAAADTTLQTNINNEAAARTAADGTLQTRVAGTCAAGSSIREVLANGTVTCETDDGGGTGTVTQVNAGTGLTGGSITTTGTLAVDTNAIQRRVTGFCNAGSWLRVLNADGSAVCQAEQGLGTVTQVSAGYGLLGGNIFNAGTLSINGAIVAQLSSNIFTDTQLVNTTATNAIRGVTSSTTGTAIIGETTATGDTVTTAGSFLSASRRGKGIIAITTNTVGPTIAGTFQTFSPDGTTIQSRALATTGFNQAGDFENASSTGTGLRAVASSLTGPTVGISAVVASPDGRAGSFTGRVEIAGDLYVSGNSTLNGSVLKGSGSFKIDHPLDPANQYLSHSFVESPDMMNVYNGNAALDGKGVAWVELPEWFETLNREFRYQLTAIGAPGPNLYIAQEVQGNRFQIAGGKPGMKVSWQVTGIRQDPFAETRRIPVEEDKPVSLRGFYLHPEAYGLPKEKGISYARRPPETEGLEAKSGAEISQVVTSAK